MIKTVVICIIYLLLAVSGMTFIKMGHLSPPFFSLKYLDISLSVKTIMGIFLYVCSYLVFVFYVSRLQISKIIPIISGLSTCLTVMIGLLIFKENISLIQYVGIALIIAGTMLVGAFG